MALVIVCMCVCWERLKNQKVHGYTSNNDQPTYKLTNTESQSKMFFWVIGKDAIYVRG